MAGRLRWAAAATAGCILVLALAVNARLPGAWKPRDVSPARERYLALQTEVRAEVLQLRQAAERAAIEPLLPAGPGLTIEVRPPYPPALADSLRAIVARELTDTTSLRARIGVFLLPAVPARPDAAQLSAWAIHHLHATTQPEPTCVAIASEPEAIAAAGIRKTVFRLSHFRADSGWVMAPHVLRGCRFWARYGAPGSLVGEWLERRGYGFAALEAEALEPWPDTLRTRSLFGHRRAVAPSLEGAALACHQGEPAACTAFFLGTTGSSHSRPENEIIGSAERALLAALEREFGPERFARFWTSEQDVALAFETAFEIPPTGWLPGWFERYYGAAEGGPGVSFATAGLSLLLVGALFGVALATVRRRGA